MIPLTEASLEEAMKNENFMKSTADKIAKGKHGIK